MMNRKAMEMKKLALLLIAFAVLVLLVRGPLMGMLNQEANRSEMVDNLLRDQQTIQSGFSYHSATPPEVRVQFEKFVNSFRQSVEGYGLVKVPFTAINKQKDIDYNDAGLFGKDSEYDLYIKTGTDGQSMVFVILAKKDGWGKDHTDQVMAVASLGGQPVCIVGHDRESNNRLKRFVSALKKDWSKAFPGIYRPNPDARPEIKVVGQVHWDKRQSAQIDLQDGKKPKRMDIKFLQIDDKHNSVLYLWNSKDKRCIIVGKDLEKSLGTLDVHSSQYFPNCAFARCADFSFGVKDTCEKNACNMKCNAEYHDTYNIPDNILQTQRDVWVCTEAP